MRETILALTLLCAVAQMAHAKPFKLGDAKTPSAEIDVPDAWKVETSDGGVEASSPDGDDYMAAEVLDVGDIAEANEVTAQFFKDEKITVDARSRQSKATTIAGLASYETSWAATDEGGPTRVRVAIVKLAPTKLLLLTRWAPPDGGADKGAAMDAIAASIKPIK